MSNALHQEIIEEWTDHGPYEPWSRWDLWHMGIFGDRWIRYRTRQNVTHTTVRRTRQTCTLKCPDGYRLVAGGCESTIGNDDPWSGKHRYALSYHGVDTTVNDETQDHPWEESDWQNRVDSPYKTLTDRLEADPVAIAGQRVNRRTGQVGGNKGFRVGMLPTLFEGDRLTLSRGRRDNSTMTVDGNQQSPNRSLIASKLGIGFHIIEFTGNDPDSDQQLRLQLPLSVISPIELNVPPITKITFEGNKNSEIVKLHLHNRSRGEHAVRIEPDSIPSGWMMLRLGDSVLVLKPGQEAEVDLQLERMVVADLTPKPLPFSVRVSFPGTTISDATAMFYVIAREVFKKGKKSRRPLLETF